MRRKSNSSINSAIEGECYVINIFYYINILSNIQRAINFLRYQYLLASLHMQLTAAVKAFALVDDQHEPEPGLPVVVTRQRQISLTAAS